MAAMPLRRLGQSDLHVSALSLGSWLTFERLPREIGVSIMRVARESGITFLDDARYNDPSGTAPLKTGYSEVVFGELFRAAGWRRDDVVVANKLWFEFWPDEDAAAELEGSLERMGFDYLDLEYCAEPPEGLAVAEVVRQVGGLIASGKLRAWGVLNWSPEQLVEARQAAIDQNVSPPCAAQLPYSLVRHSPVEDESMAHTLQSARVSVVASATLAFGILSGKYRQPGTPGRVKDRLADPRFKESLTVADELSELAASIGVQPAALAIAFTLFNPLVASTLFGATSPDQVSQNVQALAALPLLTGTFLARLQSLGH